MSELHEELFERDLTPKEFERLMAEVEASPEKAWALAQAAAKDYADTGLPAPGRSRRTWVWGAAGALALGGTLAWWLSSPLPQALKVEEQEASLSEALAVPAAPKPPTIADDLAPRPELVPQMELALVPGQDGRSQLKVQLRIRRREALGLSIEDPQGRELRRLLGGGTLEPGSRALLWDLRDSQGTLARPGSYFVRLSHAQGHELRAVQVGLKPGE